MTQREKVLLAAVGVMLLLWGGWTAVSGYRSALDAREDRLLAAERELSARKLEVLQSQEAADNLQRWRENSLPEDVGLAKREYRKWFMEALNKAGLDFNSEVRPGTDRFGGDAYHAISYMVDAEGGIDEVARFLYAFYNSPMTHKIKRLDLNPSGRQVKMTLTVEALSVAGAMRTGDDGLPEGSSGRLALADVSEYVDSIKGRNLFAPYTPPSPPRERRVAVRPEPPPRFDDASQARITAFTNDGPRDVVWVLVGTTGKRLFLYEGDKVEVGRFSGVVKTIDRRRRTMTVESDGDDVLISLGQTLREGRRVRGEQG